MGCFSEGRGDLSVASVVLLEPPTPLICGKENIKVKITLEKLNYITQDQIVRIHRLTKL